MPPAPHTGAVNPSCRLLVAVGALTLEPTTRRFDLRWNLQNSCAPDKVLALHSRRGSYTQSGSALVLRLDGGSIAYTGKVHHGDVSVSGDGYTFLFQPR